MPRPRPANVSGRKAAVYAGADVRRAPQELPVGRHTPLPERRGDKSFANDLVEDRGDVITRAVFSLRFVESKPQDLSICPQRGRTLSDLGRRMGVRGRVFFFKKF